MTGLTGLRLLIGARFGSIVAFECFSLLLQAATSAGRVPNSQRNKARGASPQNTKVRMAATIVSSAAATRTTTTSQAIGIRYMGGF